MLSSLWQSSHHCRYRGADEVAKAVASAVDELRVQHLEQAQHWYARAAALGDSGIWDRVGPPPDPQTE